MLADINQQKIDLGILDCFGNDLKEAIFAQSKTKSFDENTVLFQENDSADCMYVIITGEVRIYFDTEDDSEQVLGTLTAGQFFGEQAILPGAVNKRTAHARTITDCVLLEITRELFEHVLKLFPNSFETFKNLGSKQLRHRLLQESELFKNIELNIDIQKSLTERFFSIGDIVYGKGQNDDNFYFVLWGVAELLGDTGVMNIPIRNFGPTRYFGENEVLTQVVRKQTMRAKTELLTLVLSGKKFRELCENYPLFKEYIIINSDRNCGEKKSRKDQTLA